ncbi:carbohydrate ABC transporter permease [Cohnella phaseoli]|uniref:Raffinose/stachyose/melibiose transport system permease protein n=1 Tax=Cohnella phaseoli TaxID=456490 RepID=A0A3D9HZU4_9BACL|nr:carbohydrate ABC transporter permease [Cohnella phaseoli]RED55024.1 raffinose/stachyose/melibiose transport system permease protein [Cohnella phaseoli]
MNTRIPLGGYALRAVLVCLAVVNLYPLLFTLMTSLKTSEQFFTDIWAFPREFLVDNYVQAFEIGRIGEYFYNSVVIALVTLAMVTVVAAFAAYALARLRVPFGGAIVGLLLIIQILPTESMILPLYMMMSKLKLLGVTYVPVTFAYVGWLLPGTIVILRNFFLSIPSELLESARMDGSGEISTMFRIAFPLTGGAIATCTVLNFCFVWGELLWAQISTLTTEKGLPLTVGLINFQGQYATDWGLMTAAICMILFPLFLLFMFLQKYFVQGLTSGAVKG